MLRNPFQCGDITAVAGRRRVGNSPGDVRNTEAHSSPLFSIFSFLISGNTMIICEAIGRKCDNRKRLLSEKNANGHMTMIFIVCGLSLVSAKIIMVYFNCFFMKQMRRVCEIKSFAAESKK